MMVIYLSVKFEFDWTNRFRVRVRKKEILTDKQTKNGQMNRRNYTNFKRNLAVMVTYVPVKFEINWTNRYRVTVWKRKCGRTDKRTKTDKRTDGITPISKGT